MSFCGLWVVQFISVHVLLANIPISTMHKKISLVRGCRIWVSRLSHSACASKILGNWSEADVPRNRVTPSNSLDATFSSPRRNQLHQAVRSTIKETESYTSKWSNFRQPLPLILQTFQEYTEENEDFWFQAVSFFQRKEFKAGTVLYKRGVSRVCTWNFAG